MPHPPRPQFLTIVLLRLYLFILISISCIISISHLISPVSGRRRIFLCVCSDVPVWDRAGTFLWRCHSRSALWPRLQSHQARIWSGIFHICEDILAERFRGEEISLLLISLMGGCPLIWDKVSAQKVPLDLKDLTTASYLSTNIQEGALLYWKSVLSQLST